MPIAALQPFAEAIGSLTRRIVMPTNLGTGELRALDDAIRRNSLFSARNTFEGVLNDLKKDLESIVNPTTVQRPDRVTPYNPQGNVTEGIDPATARLRMKEALDKVGYSPDPDERGTLKDLSSDPRVNLVVKTNVELAQGAGHFIQSNDPAVIEAFPAQELVRFEGRQKERDWNARWLQAAQHSGDTDAARVLSETGRMVARKDSPIWDSLGSSDLFDDGLDNPFPPFAFNSGMWVQDVDFATAEAMRLVTRTSIPEPQQLDIETLFETAS